MNLTKWEPIDEDFGTLLREAAASAAQRFVHTNIQIKPAQA